MNVQIHWTMQCIQYMDIIVPSSEYDGYFIRVWRFTKICTVSHKPEVKIHVLLIAQILVRISFIDFCTVCTPQAILSMNSIQWSFKPSLLFTFYYNCKADAGLLRSICDTPGIHLVFLRLEIPFCRASPDIFHHFLIQRRAQLVIFESSACILYFVKFSTWILRLLATAIYVISFSSVALSASKMLIYF